METRKSLVERIDNVWFGLITGLLLPLIGYVLSYMVKYYPRSLGAYWDLFLRSDNEQTQIFTFSMIPSLLLFYFILFRWKHEYASRSFVAANLVYAVIFLYNKFFLTNG
ncbi:MAG: hypothetical protein ACHQF2_02815 [Flavobacteriales bacterium]